MAKKAPYDNALRSFLSKFDEHGTVVDRPHSDHQRPILSNALGVAVTESIINSPITSHGGIGGVFLIVCALYNLYF